jgi:hypothetical protein
MGDRCGVLLDTSGRRLGNEGMDVPKHLWLALLDSQGGKNAEYPIDSAALARPPLSTARIYAIASVRPKCPIAVEDNKWTEAACVSGGLVFAKAIR